MPVTRNQLVETTRSFVGTKFGHQGRDAATTGLDCGGLILVVGRRLGLTELEFLGYADFPTDGKFDELLEQTTDLIWERRFPFNFEGTELRPGDLLSFDYGNGEGTRHLAMVSGWDGRRYRVINAMPDYGVTEHPLAAPFVGRRTTLKAWSIRGLVD